MGRRNALAAVLGFLPVMAAAQEKIPQQNSNASATALRESTLEMTATKEVARETAESDQMIVDEIVFVGLRRVASQSLREKMLSSAGEEFSSERASRDVRTLGQLGWFESVRVEADEISSMGDGGATRVRLTFFLEELPFLTELKYAGSRLLSRRQIETLLAEKKIAPRFGEPENRVLVNRIAREIEAALHELSHPDARVKLIEDLSPNATVCVRFEIDDGPHVPVGRVTLEGNPVIAERQLRRQMRRLAPGALLAGFRGKTSYTREAFEEDRERLLQYFANHGYPEARIGAPDVSRFADTSRAWLSWPHKGTREKLLIAIPVQAGPLYKIAAVEVSDQLTAAVARNDARQPADAAVHSGAVFSAEAVENLRRTWETRFRAKGRNRGSTEVTKVAAIRVPDSETHTMRIKLKRSDSQPYIVRRLEFRGLRRFPDRYFRKRIPLKEGALLDERALETGLARLARTGYFKPIKKEDVTVRTDEMAHTANVVIRVEEKGQQRVSLVGGRGQFGNALGIAYTVYNLLDREELLSSRFEGGPESLQIALGLAKEGFFGSRGTLTLSIFNTFLRPRLIGTVKGPFFEQQSEGVSADLSYSLGTMDTMSVDYGLSHSSTKYSLGLPPGLTGLPATEVRAQSSSHSLGLGWDRNTSSEHVLFADSISGGWLGGSENLLRAKAEYGRIFHDDVFKTQNSWVFHTSFSGAGSYSGSMPVYTRWFVGDQFVRGLRDGELGPYAVVSSTSSSGATTYSATPAGANAIAAVNAEYRVSLRGRVEGATFFDLGYSKLVPNWLGPSRPSLIDATNGLLHGSTGVELRWTVPGVGVPVRVYCALNVLRLNRTLRLPDNSLFRARNRFSALGWGLGAMF